MKAVLYAENNMISVLKSVRYLIKGEGDEENHYDVNCFGDDACIYWRMLAMVV